MTQSDKEAIRSKIFHSILDKVESQRKWKWDSDLNCRWIEVSTPRTPRGYVVHCSVIDIENDDVAGRRTPGVFTIGLSDAGQFSENLDMLVLHKKGFPIVEERMNSIFRTLKHFVAELDRLHKKEDK